MDDEDSGASSFSLSDFLSGGLGIYTAIKNGQNTSDQAKLQQQLAATQAAQSAANQNQIKQILIWGSVVLTGIFTLVFLFKVLKK